MKLLSFTTAHLAATWGALDGGEVIVLGPGGLDVAPTLAAAIAAGDIGRMVKGVVPADAPRVALVDIEFLPVIPAPGKIICVGVNYKSHLAETGKEQPSAPTLFTRFPDSQIAHGADAMYPEESKKFDYEGELAVVIGSPAYRVSAADAERCVAGYAPYNDFSVRDLQLATPQWTAGKNFVGTGAFGPYLVTPEEVPDLGLSELVTTVNGVERQRARLDDLHFRIPELISFITSITPLAPGDVIVTGTPGGVGMFMDPSGLLAEGDVVEVSIDNIGVLRNTVRRGVAALPQWLYDADAVSAHLSPSRA